jgi:thiol-disulfide isomerase/thioredoxin
MTASRIAALLPNLPPLAATSVSHPVVDSTELPPVRPPMHLPAPRVRIATRRSIIAAHAKEPRMPRFSTRRSLLLGLPFVLFLALAVLAPTITPAAFAQEFTIKRRADTPDIIAIKFHADWCGSCKKMGDAFIDLSNKFDEHDVLFVTLDFTRSAQRKQSEYHLAALGLGDLWEEHGRKTGFVLLVDGRKLAIVDRLTAQDSMGAMAQKLQAALDTVQP